jgi:hypothetical protein
MESGTDNQGSTRFLAVEGDKELTLRGSVFLPFSVKWLEDLGITEVKPGDEFELTIRKVSEMTKPKRIPVGQV